MRCISSRPNWIEIFGLVCGTLGGRLDPTVHAMESIGFMWNVSSANGVEGHTIDRTNESCMRTVLCFVDGLFIVVRDPTLPWKSGSMNCIYIMFIVCIYEFGFNVFGPWKNTTLSLP